MANAHLFRRFHSFQYKDTKPTPWRAGLKPGVGKLKLVAAICEVKGRKLPAPSLPKAAKSRADELWSSCSGVKRQAEWFSALRRAAPCVKLMRGIEVQRMWRNGVVEADGCSSRKRGHRIESGPPRKAGSVSKHTRASRTPASSRRIPQRSNPSPKSCFEVERNKVRFAGRGIPAAVSSARFHSCVAGKSTQRHALRERIANRRRFEPAPRSTYWPRRGDGRGARRSSA